MTHDSIVPKIIREFECPQVSHHVSTGVLGGCLWWAGQGVRMTVLWVSVCLWWLHTQNTQGVMTNGKITTHIMTIMRSTKQGREKWLWMERPGCISTETGPLWKGINGSLCPKTTYKLIYSHKERQNKSGRNGPSVWWVYQLVTHAGVSWIRRTKWAESCKSWAAPRAAITEYDTRPGTNIWPFPCFVSVSNTHTNIYTHTVPCSSIFVRTFIAKGKPNFNCNLKTKLEPSN